MYKATKNESLYTMAKQQHRRTGLKILGGADTNLPDLHQRRENLKGGAGSMLPRKNLKNRVSNAISCILVWVFMHGASDK